MTENPWAVSGQRFPTVDEVGRTTQMLEAATAFLRGDDFLLFAALTQAALHILMAQPTPETRAAYCRFGSAVLHNGVAGDGP